MMTPLSKPGDGKVDEEYGENRNYNMLYAIILALNLGINFSIDPRVPGDRSEALAERMETRDPA
jgi:hypothetical protein